MTNLTVSRVPPAPSEQGDLWVDQTTSTLHVHNGRRFVAVGSVDTVTGFQEFAVTNEPALAGEDTARLYLIDNGFGKKQLCVAFESGVPQPLAVEQDFSVPYLATGVLGDGTQFLGSDLQWHSLAVVSGAPTAPTTLTAVAGNNQVALTWSGATLADAYDVYRRASTETRFTVLDTGVGVPTTTYTDTSAGNGATYVYRVRATNAVGSSPDSPEATASPAAPLLAPDAPNGVTATASGATATVAWLPVAGAASYSVKRTTTTGASYTTVASNLTQQTYTDGALTNNTTYFYVVVAVNAQGTSSNSAEASVTINVVTALTYPGVAASITGLGLYYRLGESSGTSIADTSGAGLTGTATGTGITYSAVSPIADGTTALGFDGAAGKITAGNANSVVGTAPFTLVAWFKPNGTPTTYGRIVSKEAYNSSATPNQNSGYGLQASPDFKAQFARYAGANADYAESAPGLLVDGTWAFLVGSYDGATMRLYVNAVLAASTVSSLSLVAHTQPFLVGAAATSASTFFNFAKGTIDEVAFYSTALTQANVTALYAAATTPGGPGPAAPPPAPVGVTATAGDARITVAWQAQPTAATYAVRYGTATGVYTSEIPTVSGTSTVLTGLTNATPYYVVVVGVNAQGRGAQSAEVTATPTAAAVPTLTLQQQIDAIATSGTGTLQAGTYRQQARITAAKTVIVPSNVTIKGSDDWSTAGASNNAWTKQAGNTWVSSLTVTNSFSMDQRAVGDQALNRPYQVFVDDVQLASVDVGTTPGPNQFRRLASGAIEMGVNPANKLVEVTTRKYWLSIEAADVTIRGASNTDRGVFKHAVPDYQRGGINLQFTNGTWHRATLKWLKMGYCHTSVVALYGGIDHSVTFCEIHNGDSCGADWGNDFATVLYGGTMSDNRIHDCGAFAQVGWHGGGCKITVRGGSDTHPFTIARNEIDHNTKGLWPDTQCGGLLIGGATIADANLIHHNGSQALHYEVSSGVQTGAATLGSRVMFNKFYQNTGSQACIVDTGRKVNVEGNIFAWNAGQHLCMHWYQGRGEVGTLGAGPTDYVVKSNYFVVDHTNGSNASTRAGMALGWQDDADSGGVHGTTTAATNTASGVNTFGFVTVAGTALTVDGEVASKPRFEYIGSGPAYYQATHSLTTFAATKYGTGSVYFADAPTIAAFLLANNLPATPTGATPVVTPPVTTTATTYYYATAGSDTANAGTSAASPWKTIAKHNATTFNPGDRHLFNRGDTFSDATLVCKSGASTALPTYYGAYGTGAVPKIRRTVTLTTFTLDTGSVYYATGVLADPLQAFQNAARLTRAASVVAMASAAGTFFWDSGTSRLYVRMTDSSNPSTKTVEASVSLTSACTVAGARYVTIEDIAFEAGAKRNVAFRAFDASVARDITLRRCAANWSSGRGFDVGVPTPTFGTRHADLLLESCTATDNTGEDYWVGQCDRVTLRACTSANNGKDRDTLGAKISQGEPAAFRVGVGAADVTLDGCSATTTYWGYTYHVESEDFGTTGEQAPIRTVVTRCTAHAGDTGATAQGRYVAYDQGKDSLWTYNVIWSQHDEWALFVDGTALGGAGAGSGGRYYHNTVISKGGGAAIRFTSHTGATVKNNIVYLQEDDAAFSGIPQNFVEVDATSESGFTADYNAYGQTGAQGGGSPLGWKWGTTRYTTIATWRSNSSQDAHAIGGTTSYDPGFTNFAGADYTLTGVATALNAGVAITGISQVVVGAAPDIGAYERGT